MAVGTGISGRLWLGHARGLVTARVTMCTNTTCEVQILFDQIIFFSTVHPHFRSSRSQHNDG
jgi:hypothetical protein